MTHPRTWKRAESRIAAMLGGQRNPLSGGASRHTRGDVIHEVFYTEVKYRQAFATFAAWADTALKAKHEGKIPLLVLCQKGTPRPLVVLSLRDFVDLKPLGVEDA